MTLELGQSGAEIKIYHDDLWGYTVKKSGGTTDLQAQATLCTLMPDVCPAVYRRFIDGYAMEAVQPLLDRPVLRTHEFMRLFTLLHRTLSSKVWIKPAHQHNPSWKSDLVWAMNNVHPNLGNFCAEMLTLENVGPVRLIHGDPTIANLMKRDGQPCIIDPVPCRAMLPSVPALDMAKIVQSALGWERFLDPETFQAEPDFTSILWLVEEWCREFPGMEPRAVLTLAAVNCQRILSHNYSPECNAWARTAMTKAMRHAREL